MWFSYHWDEGFYFHDTEEAAKAAAEDHVKIEREYAKDSGWAEELETTPICWGKIIQIAKMTDIEECQSEDPDEENYSSDYDYLCNFKLCDSE